ncbi:MAG: hypothetical protein ACE5MG_13775, partial [Candidatus Methylomirabilales bacterium]
LRFPGPVGPVTANSPTVLAPARARLNIAGDDVSSAAVVTRCAPRRGAPRSPRHPPAPRFVR